MGPYPMVIDIKSFNTGNDIETYVAFKNIRDIFLDILENKLQQSTQIQQLIKFTLQQ